MDFFDDRHSDPSSRISQCTTAKDQVNEALLAGKDASEWPQPEPLTPWPVDNVLKGIGSSLYPIQTSHSPELSIRRRSVAQSPITKLDAALRDACIEVPKGADRKYIPLDKQHELITRDSVLEIMSAFGIDLDGENKHSVVDQILPLCSHSNSKTEKTCCMSRRKLFAILVMLGEPGKIFSFIRDGIWDDHLPLQRTSTTKGWESQDGRESGKTLEVAWFNDENWYPPLKDLFEKYQWYLLSPVFDMSSPTLTHYSLHKNTPLPFLKNSPDDEPPVPGGFGKVRRVRIHPAHHTMTSKDLSYAVKCLESKCEDEFEREVKVLSRFRNHDDPHLVKLLATYYDGEHYNLIFPWANSNLREHWRRNPRPAKSYHTALWIAEQNFGIAEALRKIHCDEFPRTGDDGLKKPRKGRHGDIKAENILLFPSSNYNTGTIKNHPGVLVLADFGLTRFHTVDSAHRRYYHTLAASWTYRAPEFDLNRKVSPSWDIWTLGCVYLEFVIWYLQGWEALKVFSAQRKECDLDSPVGIQHDRYFYQDRYSKFGAYRKPTVVRRIKELHSHPDCTEFIHDFLNLISEGMLRIRSEKRMDCADISRRMQEMWNECKMRPAYCNEPTPKTFIMARATNESDKKSIFKGMSNLLCFARAVPRFTVIYSDEISRVFSFHAEIHHRERQLGRSVS